MNLVAPVLLILGAVSTTVGVGGASLVSRRLGAGDPNRAARSAGTAFTVYWSIAVVVTLLGLVFLEPLLTVLGADDSTRPLARDYAVIIIAGAIVATGFSSLVRAEGRMRFSTMLWVVPVLTQILLDPLLIFGAGLGVRGAAFGTVGGQLVSAAMSVWFFFVQRNRPYRIRLTDLRPRLGTIGELVAIGAPSFLAGFGATLLAVLVNNLLAGSGGVVALAAFALCSRLQTFVAMPQLGIAQGLQPIVGFNTGRGQADRAGRARVLALRATVIYGAVAALLVALAAPILVGAFVDDPAVLATAVPALRIIAVGFAVAGVAPLLSAYFQAIGSPRPSYLISVGTLVLIKVPLVLLLGRLGLTGLWISLPLGELLAAFAAYLVWRSSAQSFSRSSSPT